MVVRSGSFEMHPHFSRHTLDTLTGPSPPRGAEGTQGRVPGFSGVWGGRTLLSAMGVLQPLQLLCSLLNLQPDALLSVVRAEAPEFSSGPSSTALSLGDLGKFLCS